MYLSKLHNPSIFKSQFCLNRIFCHKRTYLVTKSSTVLYSNCYVALGKPLLVKQFQNDFASKSVNVFKRLFHTSTPNKALPPILWVLIRQFLKFAAVVTGRGLRKWWANLPKDRRQYLLQEIKKRQRQITWGTAISGGVVYAYYITHLIEDPINKRKKFIIFSEKQILQMAKIESESVFESYKGHFITSGNLYNNVLRIARRIIEANKILPIAKRNWRLLIIDEDTTNAFVLPSGEIFIFTGMIKTVNNDDQLAAIIGHEMAHALLSHSAEIASKTHLLELLLLLPLLIVWTLLPDTIALSSHYLTEYIADVMFKLPFSRKLESEADILGLEMISRACFDPRQASVFWRQMDKLAEQQDIEWLSTHPSHKTRYETLESLMPNAFRILTSHCKPDLDPRSRRN